LVWGILEKSWFKVGTNGILVLYGIYLSLFYIVGVSAQVGEYLKGFGQEYRRQCLNQAFEGCVYVFSCSGRRSRSNFFSIWKKTKEKNIRCEPLDISVGNLNKKNITAVHKTTKNNNKK